MTRRATRRLKTLCAHTRKYSRVVERKLSKTATHEASEVFVESAAKYYVALKKLATK